MHPDRRRTGRTIRKQQRAALAAYRTYEQIDWTALAAELGRVLDTAVSVVGALTGALYDAVAAVVGLSAAVAEEERRRWRMTYRALPARLTNHARGEH